MADKDAAGVPSGAPADAPGAGAAPGGGARAADAMQKVAEAVEGRLRAWGRAVGDATSTCPYGAILAVGMLYLLLGVGIVAREVETDVWELWVDDSTRLIDELDFYDSNFGNSRTQALILTAKNASVPLLSKEAMREAQELQDWFFSTPFTYKMQGVYGPTVDVTLNNICLKAVDDRPQDPCYLLTPLDCFAEGGNAVLGKENNTVPWQSYDSKPSIECVDFEEDFTLAFSEQYCRYWFNLEYPYHISFGGTSWAPNTTAEAVPGLKPTDSDAHANYTLKSADSLRMAFFTLDERELLRKGLRNISWELPEQYERDVLTCPKAECDVAPLGGNATMGCDCWTCIEEFSAVMALEYGCVPDSTLTTQAQTCCDWISQVRDHACVEILWATDATSKQIGSYVLNQCQLPPVTAYKSIDRCSAVDAALTTYVYPSCWPDDPSTMCDTGTLAGALGPCLSGASQACCDGIAASVGVGASGNSENCFCHESVMAGAQAFLPTVADVFDECKTTYGVDAYYFGQDTTGGANCGCSGASSSSSAPAAENKTYADWPSSLSSCGSDVLTAALLPCLTGPSQKCCDAMATSVADGAGSSANCFCVESILLGALALVGPTVTDIIDSCKNDYGVPVYYQGRDHVQVGGKCNPVGPCYDPDVEYGTHTKAIESTVNIYDEDEALRILKGWEKNWLSLIEAKAATFKYIDVSYFSTRSLPDTFEDASNSEIGLLVLAYALLFGYTIAYYTPWPMAPSARAHKVPPGPIIAASAIFALALSTWAALGVAGFLCYTKLKFNALTFRVVPFLGLGLGINDFYVLTNSLKAVYVEWPEDTAEVAIGRMMSHGGVSVTLSSVTNIFVFFLGALVPIPAVRAFTVHIGLVEFFNYMLTLFVFPPLLLISAKAYKKKEAAVVSELSEVTPSPTMSRSRSKKPEPPKHVLVPQPTWPFLSTPAGVGLRAAIVCLNIALLGLFASWIDDVELGLKAKDVLPSGTYMHDFATKSDDFCSRPVYLTFKGIDFESNVDNFRSLEYEFVNQAPHMDVSYESSNFLRYYTEFIEAQLCSGVVCFNEVEYYYDGWRTNVNVCEGKTDCFSYCSNLCSHVGAPSDKKCRLENDNTECYCDYRPRLKSEHFYNITTTMDMPEGDFNTARNFRVFDSWMTSSINGQISKWLTNQELETYDSDHSHGKMTGALSLAFVEDVCDLDPVLEHIRGARKIVDRSPINAAGVSPGGTPKNVFAFDWIVYALNEQYLHIEDGATTALVIAFCTMFVVMLPLIVHPLASFWVTVSLVIIEVQLYGLLYVLDLKMNAITLVNLLVAVGIAVEYVAHVGRAFMVATGTRSERCFAAFMEMVEPLGHGTMSTFFGLLPVAFSDFDYFVTYFFIQYVVILVVCLWNGLVFLPCLLSFVGPPSVTPAPPRGPEAA